MLELNRAGCACHREMTLMVCKQEGVNEPCSMPQGMTDILTLVFMRSFFRKVQS